MNKVKHRTPPLNV